MNTDNQFYRSASEASASILVLNIYYYLFQSNSTPLDLENNDNSFSSEETLHITL